MKENKKKKINVVAVILTVAVAINVAMSAYICVDKVNDKKSVAEHESVVYDMQKNIDDLQKTIDAASIDQSVSELQDKVETLVANNEHLQFEKMLLIGQIDSMFTDDQSSEDIKAAKELFEKGAEKIMEAITSDYSRYPMAVPYEKPMINGYPYEKRDVLYSDVVKEYSEIFTGDILETVLNERFAEKDGYLYILQWGSSGWGIQNIKINKVSESGDEKTYQVKSERTADNGEVFDVNICTMTVKQVNGSPRISEFNYKDGSMYDGSM